MNPELDLITSDPYETFGKWFEMAKEAEPNDPNAMNLATADSRRRPSNRMVLLNGLDDRGFVFYTNAQGRKGTELAENPFASLCFYWKSLRRQVRIEGRVEAVSPAESDAYFNSRPRDSRIGAWASQQSRLLADYQDLKDAVAAYKKKFEGVEIIPRPDYWQGYRVAPDKFEFWINGEYKLHRRYIYIPEGTAWSIHMINP